MPSKKGRINSGGRECARCGEYKPWDLFSKSRSGTRGHHSWRKACMGAARGQKPRQKSIVTEEGRVCTSCREFKPWTEYRKHSRAKTGHQTQCKACIAAKYKYGRKYARNTSLKYKYGLALDEYRRMLESQGGVCAICGGYESASNGKEIDSFAVDHNHKTGTVRGLLCRRCNTLLGFAQDDVEILEKAIDYLESSGRS